MAIWSFSEHSGEQIVHETYPETPLPPPRLSLCEPTTSPRLEVSEVDVVPFSHNFLDLFEGLGLNISGPEAKNELEDSPDFSYDIENFTNIRDIDPEWHHDGIEEIIIMSSKRPSALSTIQEDCESSPVLAPFAVLSDFELDEADPLSKDDVNSEKICTKRDTGKKYVVKSQQAYTGSVWTEQAIIECLTELSLPFTPYMRWSFQSGEHIYMIMDHYANGSLVDFINKHGSLGSHRALFYATELVSAIASLHDVGIIHRNLNPTNVVLDADGHLVLTNFDCAEFLPASSNTRGTTSATAFERGLTQYQAPEILLGWTHNSAVDCWGFGMLLYFLFFGMYPLGRREASEDRSMIHNRIIQYPIPMESLRLVHPMARDLVLQCLERNPALRWDMAQIKKHGYFHQVDWRQVSAKGLEVPFFGRPTVEPDFGIITDTQKRPISLNPSFLDKDRQLSLHQSSNIPVRRSQTMKGNSRVSLTQNIISSNAETLRSVKATIPVIFEEEEEATSELGTMGHTAQIAKDERWEEIISPSERMSSFWDNFDKEERASAASTTSVEFGESMGIPFNQAPKLRKHRSSIHPQQRLFNLSTLSFQKKLRMKPRSPGALRLSKPVEPILNLPNGIHQLGSGIGFTYNVPSAVSSKLSVSSFAPANCQSIFHGGFSLNLGLGLGNVTRKAKQKPIGVTHSQPIDEPDVYQDIGVQDGRPRDAGNATFMRDMYRTPSWILSPPDSLPSPMALVTSDSPASESEEAFSPMTMVDSEEETEVNITIPKNLDLEYEFPDGTLDSTLRLVPSSPVLTKSPLAMPAEIILFEEM